MDDTISIVVKAEDQFGTWKFSHMPGFDIGVYLNPLDHYRFGDLGLSLTATDVILTQIHWDGIENTSITTSRFREGIRYAAMNDNLVVSAEYLLDNALGKLYEAMDWDAYLNMVFGKNIKGTWEGINPLVSRLRRCAS